MNEFSVHFQLAPKLPSCPHLFDGRVGIPHSLLRSLIVLLLLCLSWIVKLVFAEAFLVLWTNIAIRSEMIFLHWDFLFFHFFCVECLAFNHHILYLLFSIPKDKQCTSLFSIFFLFVHNSDQDFPLPSKCKENAFRYSLTDPDLLETLKTVR